MGEGSPSLPHREQSKYVPMTFPAWVRLMGFRLATAQAEIEVARVRITEAGRQALRNLKSR
jgi:hypothetical protein